jgi:uncharacterized Zn finger protein (UPF0148 family)
MEELKCCLFCGRYIDKSFRYCPYCGYEFTAREELGEQPEESAEEQPSNFEPAEFEPDSMVAWPAPVETRQAGDKAADRVLAYLERLRDIEKHLSDMERELDFIISRARPLQSASRGPVTSSSKGP